MDVTKLKQSALVQFFFGFTFLVSGLLINVIQLLMLPLWYMGNKVDYRTAIRILNTSYWTIIPSVAQWWANLRVDAYCTPETFYLLGKEPAVITMNHRGELDWVVSWIMCDYARILGNAKCFVKKVIRYVPCIGWSFWMSEFICLKRSLEHDKRNIDEGLKNLGTFRENFWLLIFCEGTRFTKAKHEKSVEFAKKKNLPQLKHHLLPRTKGFTIACNGLRSTATCVYDVTVAWHDQIELTLHDMVMGKPCKNSCLVRRIPIEDVPEDETASSEFLHQIYREKDVLCDFHMTNNRFPTVEEAKEMKIQYYDDVERRTIRRKKRNLCLLVSWFGLSTYFLYLLATVLVSNMSFWSITFFITGVAIVAGLFYMMMQAGKPQSSYGA